MKEIWSIVATIAGALLVIGVATFGAGDRETLVPVPEAVAESFTREVTTRRFDLAMRFLAHQTQRSETPSTLEARFDALVGMTGKVSHVAGERQWLQGDRAAAIATVEGDAGHASIPLEMTREDGLWRIVAMGAPEPRGLR